MKLRLGVVFVLLSIVAATAWAVEPKIVKASYNHFTDEDEQVIGAKLSAMYEDKNPVVNSSLLNGYVNKLVAKLGEASQRPSLQYRAKVVDSNEINASSLPGGYIYVNRGLLEFANNESELAGVLGHEVGHAAARHSLNVLARQQVVIDALDQARARGIVLTDEMANRIASQIGGAIWTLIERANSRDQEREADLLGFYETLRAGWNPHGGVTFLERLAGFTGEHSIVDRFLSTHPPYAERTSTLVNELKSVALPNDLIEDSMSFKAMKLALGVVKK